MSNTVRNALAELVACAEASVPYTALNTAGYRWHDAMEAARAALAQSEAQPTVKKSLTVQQEAQPVACPELGDRFMEILRAIHGDMPDAFADSARLAFVHALKEAQPAPTPVELLERWGRSPEGTPHLLQRMDDGYWTPWHIAQSALECQANYDAAQLRAALAEKPAAPAYVPLSDDDIHAIYDKVARLEPYSGAVTRRNVARAIESLVVARMRGERSGAPPVGERL